MIAHALEQGDALLPGVASNMVGDLAGALYSGLPASRLKPLLQSESVKVRGIGVRVALLAGPYAKDILEDVRLLMSDPDSDVRETASHAIRQAIAVGWLKARWTNSGLPSIY